MLLDPSVNLVSALVPYVYFSPFHSRNVICYLVEGLLCTEGLFSKHVPKDYQKKSVCEGHSVFCGGRSLFFFFLDYFWFCTASTL